MRIPDPARVLITAALIALAWAPPARAAGATADERGWTFAGSVRLRHEGLSGQSRPGFREDDQLISTRTILGAGYDAGALRFVAELIDSRAWLADRSSPLSTSEVNALEPVQLYVGLDLDQPWGPDSRLAAQLGRFTMNVGSRRLIANDDYRNTNSSNTGLRLDGTHRGWSATAWYVLPSTRLPDDLASLLRNDIQLDQDSASAVTWGGLLTSPRRVLGGAVEAMFMSFRERDTPTRPTRDRALDNWNLRWFRDPTPGGWDHEFETTLQQGRARTGTATAAPLQAVDASFWHARVGYQWATRWKPRLAVEYDWVSGETDGPRIRRYDTLFGFRRGDFAPSGLYAQLARANISSPGLRFEAAPGPRLEVMATWKLLQAASRTDAFSATGVRDAAGASGRHAGQQFDARVRWWLVPRQLRLETNAVLLRKGRLLETAPNARPGDTRFLSLALTYTLL